jgi:DNA-binding MarR family transcriptional regulator
MTNDRRQPRRLMALPMYIMLALGREGYRNSLKMGLKIRMPHYAVMAILAEFGPSSQRSIAECAGFDKSDVTKIVNDLENQKLVRRLEDKEDTRRHRVTLTSKGKRQLETSDKELNNASQAFLRGLTPEEYRQLNQLLLKAIQVYDERFILT